MSRSLRTFGKALGVLIMLVGLSGIPGDLANWASWVGETSGEQWRWALLLLGLAAAVGSSVPDLWERFGRQQPSSDGTTGPPPARAGRGELPTGTVTFLFTDIEGSTRLLQELGEGYAALRDDQAAIVRHAVRSPGQPMVGRSWSRTPPGGWSPTPSRTGCRCGTSDSTGCGTSPSPSTCTTW
jgi:hypothetical protein